MKRTAPWLLGFLATAVVLRRAVFSSELFLARDMLRGHLPLKTFAAEQWRQGRLGDWYPFDAFGQSNSGMVVSWPFHPANLLFLPLDTALAMKVLVLLSHVFAVAGVCLWLRALGQRAWVSGALAVTFAFCGYLVSINNNLNYLIAAATVPWLGYSGWSLAKNPRPRAAAAAGALLGSLALAGEPQAFVIGAALITAQWISARGLKPGWLIPTGVLAAGVGAIQILPALGIRSAVYAGNATMEIAGQFSGHPLKALEFFFGPLFLTESGEIASNSARTFFEPRLENLWVETQYLSPLVMAFAILAVATQWRAQKVLLGAWALIFLLWLGPHTPVYGLFFDWLPFWSSFRYPEKLTPWVVLGLCVAAADGVELLLNRKLNERLVFGVLALLMLGAAVTAASSGSELTSHFSGPALQSLGVLAIAALILWRAPALRERAIPALLAVPVLLWSSGVYLLSPASVFAPSEFVRALPAQRDEFRVSSSAAPQSITDLPPGTAGEVQSTLIATSLRPNTPGIWGVSSAGSYFAGGSARVLELLRFKDDPLHTARFEVKQAEPGQQPLVSDDSLKLALIQKPSASRARLVKGRCVANRVEAQAQLLSIDAFHEALIECAGPIPQPETVEGTVKATWLPYDAPTFEISSPTGGLFVLDDAYYPGWSATLDTAAVEILPANLAFRGVVIPPGTHQLDFHYRTPGLVPGAWLTALSVLAALGLALAKR